MYSQLDELDDKSEDDTEDTSDCDHELAINYLGERICGNCFKKLGSIDIGWEGSL